MAGVTKLYSDGAELYDIAFDWDVSDEVDWLFERLGRPHAVLEPGCGSGRMLEAFTRRDVDVAGIDASPPPVGRDATGGLLWHELRLDAG